METEAQEERGIILVEQLRSSEDTNRNVIETAKNNHMQGWREERYKNVLNKAKFVTFYVGGLSCAGIRDAVKMPSREDLGPCNTQTAVRKLWFSYFAHTYGVEGGGLPRSTCFIDVVGLDMAKQETGDDMGEAGDAGMCTAPVSFTSKATGTALLILSAPPLSQQLRDKYRQQIIEALQKTPADTFKSCWIPDGLNEILPYTISSKFGACAKRAFLLTTYPQFHVS